MQNEIRVWDPLVRIFHWSLVVSFAIAYFSGDEENAIHIYSGYIVAALISFRLIWGFIGSRHARFSDFVYSPRTVLAYMKSMMTGQVRRYIGHNPEGGAMIVVLLLSLAVVSYSGLKVYAIEDGEGPLAQQSTELGVIRSAYADDEYDEHEDHHDDAEEMFWEEVHEASANLVLLLVALHVAGVLMSGRWHHENLVKAMITGNKKSH